MLTSVEGNSVQAFSKGNNLLPHFVAVCWRFSVDDVHTSTVKLYVLDGRLGIMHFTLLYTVHYTLF
jgi:hypothetical protein